MNCLIHIKMFSKYFKLTLLYLLLVIPIITQAGLLKADSFSKALQEVEARPFITIWKTDNLGSSLDNQITIPTDQSEDLGLVYNYDIYWEDVSDANINGSESAITGNHTIDFPTPGTYRVKITGQFPKIFFNNAEDKSKILSVEQWGDIVWEDMGSAFYGCDELSINALDSPNLNEIVSMWEMFRESNINQNINHWDVSNVTDIGNLFRDTKLFNQPLDNWDVSNVTNMPQVFMGADSFNGDIGTWDVSRVTNMGSMFNGAKKFNKDIGLWNVGNVVRMNAMFQGATSFNQNIGNWDVSNVTTMDKMFRNATVFNQPIGKWDVSKVSVLSYMFNLATNFNSDISEWNVSSVVDTRYMFREAISFNQDIGNWSVSKVTNMTYMFFGASNFDQDISNWDVSNVTDMSYMLRESDLSPYNYDELLKGWLANGVQNGITNFQVHGLSYCAGEDARDILTDDYDWKITGDGKDCDQKLTFEPLEERMYGYPTFKLEGKVSSGAAVVYTSSKGEVAVVYGDSVEIVGAGTTTITASQPGNAYYSSATSISRELKVNKADQTIVFGPIEDKVIGDEDFYLVATVDSGLDITFESSDENVAKVVGNAVKIIGVGAAEIIASQGGDNNYNAASNVEQALTVHKKEQSIIFDALQSQTILDDDFDLTAVASSGLGVVYTSSNEEVATILNNKITIVGLGMTTIIAMQPGDAEYAPATEVSRELIITKVPQQITFEPLVDRLSDAPDFEIAASASSELPVAFTVSGPAAIQGNTVSLKGTPGIVSVTATQGGNDIYSSAEPIVRTFEVVAAPVTGIQDLLKEGISIYPNPILETLTIELGEARQAVVFIIDVGGNIVMQHNLNAASNLLNFSSLTSGFYFVKIQLKNTVLYQKVLKE